MIVYAIFATVSWFIIERAGRRKLFLWGTVGQGLSMVLVFSCLIPGTTTAAKGAAVGLFTYIASFGATWLPLPWVCSYSWSNRIILMSLPAIPCRDQSDQDPRQSKRHVHLLELAVQLPFVSLFNTLPTAD